MMTEAGPEAITHQRVAEHTGVSRPTLYRHWPNPEELIFEALAQIVMTWEFSGPGRLGDELIAEIKRRRTELNQPSVRMAFTTVISRALWDPAAALLRDRLIDGISSSLRASVAVGIERGELRADLKPEILVAQVMGAMVWRSFVNNERVTSGFIEEIVREALNGWELSLRSAA
jgi:AcrR family transcriptional regulator